MSGKFLNKTGKVIKDMVSDRNKRFLHLAAHGLCNWMSDEQYIKHWWNTRMDVPLNLENPVTFNEKIQWLKIHDHNPEYTSMADKYLVKEIVARKAGKEYVIPAYGGGWEHFDEIPFDILPEKFVLKCTHDSGSVIFVKDKNQIDNTVKCRLERSLRANYYNAGREWVYKNIKPRIIAEKFITDDNGQIPDDYKFFCFNGEPRLIQVDFDRFTEHKRNLYTPEWELIDGEIHFPSDKNRFIPKPEKLDEMLHVAKCLSQGIPHVRVDLYCIQNRVLFGEVTFYHGSGTERFYPEELGVIMGSWIDLPYNA